MNQALLSGVILESHIVGCRTVENLMACPSSNGHVFGSGFWTALWPILGVVHRIEDCLGSIGLEVLKTGQYSC